MKRSYIKLILAFAFTLFLVAACAQNEDYAVLLNKAKESLKNERDASQEELNEGYYEEIVALLEKVITLKPDNTEAKYFLGYAYSRLNSSDGKSMINMNPELVLKSSEQFEAVNKLSPKYTGELFILDPYSKITSEWGSMAMCYLYNDQPDSASWAFHEGKKRGGFSDYILQINRETLEACTKNSILLTSGDSFTIPLWYLQSVEKYRKDVAIIDVAMLNTTWYPSFLFKNKIIRDNPEKENVNTEDYYIEWTDSLITINDFSWRLKPRFYDHYLIRSDIILLNILQNNKLDSDVYFTPGFSSSESLGLKDYTYPMIVVDKFCADRKETFHYDDYKKLIKEILMSSKYLNKNSTDEVRLFGYYRYYLLMQINHYLDIDEIDKAKELLYIHDEYGEEASLPYQSDFEKRIIGNIRYKLSD